MLTHSTGKWNFDVFGWRRCRFLEMKLVSPAPEIRKSKTQQWRKELLKVLFLNQYVGCQHESWAQLIKWKCHFVKINGLLFPPGQTSNRINASLPAPGIRKQCGWVQRRKTAASCAASSLEVPEHPSHEKNNKLKAFTLKVVVERAGTNA